MFGQKTQKRAGSSEQGMKCSVSCWSLEVSLWIRDAAAAHLQVVNAIQRSDHDGRWVGPFSTFCALECIYCLFHFLFL